MTLEEEHQQLTELLWKLKPLITEEELALLCWNCGISFRNFINLIEEEKNGKH